MTQLYPALFISHGGGPCFWTDWNPPDLFSGLRSFFEQLPQRLPRTPKAIVVVSAHWEDEVFKVQGTPLPGMIYDYFGFPPETYQLAYPAAGSVELAAHISRLLDKNSIQHSIDTKRGYDHGVYVPLLISYPEANIPVLQISLRSDLSSEGHFELGKALRPLREDNILILGSGFSYHNLGAIPDRMGVSQVFDNWLCETLIHSDHHERKQKLINWISAPCARKAHPREEHLLPLLVCAGTAEFGTCMQIYSEKLKAWNVQLSCFQFD